MRFFKLNFVCPRKANMSPNLSSQHFPPNRLLYEQVIFNLFRLVGIVPTNRLKSDDPLMRQPQAAFKDLAVFPDRCATCTGEVNCTQVNSVF